MSTIWNWPFLPDWIDDVGSNEPAKPREDDWADGSCDKGNWKFWNGEWIRLPRVMIPRLFRWFVRLVYTRGQEEGRKSGMAWLLGAELVSHPPPLDIHVPIAWGLVRFVSRWVSQASPCWAYWVLVDASCWTLIPSSFCLRFKHLSIRLSTRVRYLTDLGRTSKGEQLPADLRVWRGGNQLPGAGKVNQHPRHLCFVFLLS